ncbi:DUF6734 family protein [Ascidiimonas aurantiaca]|uniref:DUF6734 family protein n=1 Tax=Ascidiimonas aurantiaca TaxID=1685432 RepID=UPI0030EC70EE
MRIVQTFWSGKKPDPLRSYYGWAAPKYHWLGWILSSNQLIKYYDEVELYTDRQGYDILINKLKLPYTKVHVGLDELNTYDSDLWALPKIYTYSLQDEPFLHVDGDVFVWERFPDDLLTSPLIAQNLERETKHYKKMLEGLNKHILFYPPEIQEEFDKGETVKMYNMGITGGNNIAFFKEYVKKAFDFVDKNAPVLDKICRFNFNIFFEQLLFYCLAQKENREVGCLIKKVLEDSGYGYKDLGAFEEVPLRRTYLHLLGDFKRNVNICRNMETYILHEYPEYLERLSKLMPKTFTYLNGNENLFSLKKLSDKEILSSFYEVAIQQEKTIVAPMPNQIDNEFLNAYVKNQSPSSTYLLGRDVASKIGCHTFLKITEQKEDFLLYKLQENAMVEVDFMEKISPLAVNNSTKVDLVSDACVVLVCEIDGHTSEYIIDEIDQVILEELEKPIRYSEFLDKMLQYVDMENPENTVGDFIMLMNNRLHDLIAKKVIALKI